MIGSEVMAWYGGGFVKEVCKGVELDWGGSVINVKKTSLTCKMKKNYRPGEHNFCC